MNYGNKQKKIHQAIGLYIGWYRIYYPSSFKSLVSQNRTK
jgi:hypothetical protein